MKLTKNWLPLLGIYLMFGILIGIILTLVSNCGCWLFWGLFVGTFIWYVHQTTVQKPERRKRKTNEKNK